MHVDYSGQMEQEGIAVTMIASGKYKVDGHPYAPLSEEARGRLQSMCDGYYSDFVNSVAKNRGVAVSAVRGGPTLM
jgi:ClpP class serine protease